MGERITIDVLRHRVLLGKKEIHTTPIEYRLLLCLLASKGESVLARPFIIEKVWPDSGPKYLRTVDQHVKRLRDKIGRGKIVTVDSYGYRWQQEAK